MAKWRVNPDFLSDSGGESALALTARFFVGFMPTLAIKELLRDTSSATLIEIYATELDRRKR